jgi:hypothetical protein
MWTIGGYHQLVLNIRASLLPIGRLRVVLFLICLCCFLSSWCFVDSTCMSPFGHAFVRLGSVAGDSARPLGGTVPPEDVAVGSGGRGSARLDRTVPSALESDRVVSSTLPPATGADGR